MKQFKIPVVWQMYGVMHIEANSLEEAKQKAFDLGTSLPDGNYIEDSCQLDDDEIIKEMNP